MAYSSFLKGIILVNPNLSEIDSSIILSRNAAGRFDKYPSCLYPSSIFHDFRANNVPLTIHSLQMHGAHGGPRARTFCEVRAISRNRMRVSGFEAARSETESEALPSLRLPRVTYLVGRSKQGIRRKVDTFTLVIRVVSHRVNSELILVILRLLNLFC